jgi:hypothetical protein
MAAARMSTARMSTQLARVLAAARAGDAWDTRYWLAALKAEAAAAGGAAAAAEKEYAAAHGRAEATDPHWCLTCLFARLAPVVEPPPADKK